MTNKTELPDLDLNELEALCAAAPRMWYGTLQIADGVTDDAAALLIEACSPDTVAELVRLARRAQPEGGIPQLSKAFMTVESNGGEGRHIVLKFNQREDAYAVHDFLLKAGRQDSRASAKPEGEAPQAVPVKPWREAFRDQYPNYPQVELPWETKFNWAELEIAQLRAAPAAQHAESGAQAADHVRQKFEAWAEDVGYPTRRGFGNANDYDFVQTRRMWESWQAALAAQSQGAQPSVTFSVDGTSMSPWEYIDYLHDQLAAKAEAPAPGDLALLAALANAADVFMKGGVAPLRPLIDRAKAVTVAAQQAAAPGALDPNVFFDALSDFKDSRMTADDAQEFFDKLAAPSAPGTPEAPADQDAKDAERYRALRDAKKIPGQVWNALETGEDVDEAVDLLIELRKPIPFCEPCKAGRYDECEQVFPCVLPRAAQLDGGQGEGGKHG